MRHYTLLHNALRDDPLRIDVDAFDAAIQERRLRFRRPTHHTHRQPLVAVDGVKLLRRHVQKHIFVFFGRIAVGSPAATLHVTHHTHAPHLRGLAVQPCQQFSVEGVGRL